MKRPSAKLLMRTVFWCVTVASVLFLVKYAATLEFTAVLPVLADANWIAWFIAALLAFVHVAICGFVFTRSLSSQHARRLWPVYVLSQVAKYVPGRIWSVVLQRTMIGSGSSSLAVISANLRISAAVVWSQLIALLALCSILGMVSPLFVPVFVAGIFAVDGALSYFARSSRWSILEAWKAPQAAGLTVAAAIGGAMATSAAWWTLYSWGFSLDGKQSVEAIAVSTASFLAGLASALPAGLGTRDAAFVLLGRLDLFSLEAAMIPALALASRLWLLMVDVVSAVVAGTWLLIERRRYQGA